MIVRPVPDGTLHLITQPDHARLAAALISAWDPTALPASFRTAVLLAIAEHDNGWLEVDAEPTVAADTGRAHDFMDLPAGLKRGIWPRGIRRLARASPLAAALAAEHALTLHARRRGDPDWRGFFEDIEDLRGRLLEGAGAETGIDRQAFDRAYDLLFIGDVASLVFCNGWREPTEARGYRLTLADDGATLVVSPDPFGRARVEFEVTARAIPDRRYPSDLALREALAQAPTVRLRGSAIGAASPR